MKAMALLLALSSSAFASGSAKTHAAAVKCVPQKTAKKAILALPDGGKIKIDIADTPATREIGLMCVRKMPRTYGMLFVFPQDMYLNFWMKNTLVPLDIVWIGADKKITVIHEKLHESTVDTPDEKIVTVGGRGQFVLELASGEAERRGLKAGDKLEFSAEIPER
ncbi:MAG: hypothetical protein COV48_12170 [Elusimicrobia bacterium CG11_big_fil_rev_8_21_14_0_20_64_6]|nr:MAG: hypothetical protein COV48_12170 [Elusimicrobia bacterium CG11_big_fil_rev_8_21_14_0_20_64_6]